MKLLQPTENKALKEEEQVRSILRIQELEKAEKKARLNLAKAELDFQITLKKNQETWASEEGKHNDEIRARIKEIELLELRKASALEPINDKKRQVEALEKEAIEYLKVLKEKEEYNDDLTEKLQDKLDGVGQREQNLTVKEKQLNSRVLGVKAQEEHIKVQNIKLNDEINRFKTYIDTQEKDINERKTALVLWDRTLNAKEEMLKRTEKILYEKEVRLNDERQNVQKVWDELGRKYPPIKKP